MMYEILNNSPTHLLKHAPCLIGNFFIHAALFRGIDFSVAEFFFEGVEAWRCGCKYRVNDGERGGWGSEGRGVDGKGMVGEGGGEGRGIGGGVDLI